MKTCPYCAESIQDQAIVCKHCRKDLGVTAPVTPVAPKKTRWGRLFGIVAIVVAVPIIAVQCGSDHARFLEFSARRDAWHQKCDRYVNVPNTRSDPAAQACQTELAALMAEAKREGWAK